MFRVLLIIARRGRFVYCLFRCIWRQIVKKLQHLPAGPPCSASAFCRMAGPASRRARCRDIWPSSTTPSCRSAFRRRRWTGLQPGAAGGVVWIFCARPAPCTAPWRRACSGGSGMPRCCCPRLITPLRRKLCRPWRQLQRPAVREAPLPYPGGMLPAALCSCEKSPAGLRYFDTPESLRQKLAHAAAHGCRCAIGLWQELQPFFPERDG